MCGKQIALFSLLIGIVVGLSSLSSVTAQTEFIPPVNPDQIIFYEPFESTQGILDNGGGTLSSFTTGVIGHAADFTEGSKVCYPLQNNFNENNGTIAFWMKQPLKTYQGIIIPPPETSEGLFDIGELGEPNSWGIFYNFDHIIMEVKDNDTPYANYDQAWSKDPLYFDTEWHHIVGVWHKKQNNYTSFRVFVDGEGKEIDDGSIDDTFPDMTGDFCLGWSGFYGVSYAIMDEAIIYNYTMNASDVLALYDSYPGPPLPPVTVKSHQKISDAEGNFTGTLTEAHAFGSSVASLGDLDGDGVTDIATGGYLDDNNNLDRGAVWILFLNSNGTIKRQQKINNTEGNFTGEWNYWYNDHFGRSLAPLGDMNADGVTDIAVGAPGINDDQGAVGIGAVWILFLNRDGTVKHQQKISSTEGNFSGILNRSDNFGHSLASLGDFNRDGITDIVVGAVGDDDGGSSSYPENGAVWILFLNSDGTVKGHQKISETAGNFTADLDYNQFGYSVASIGDLNNDSVGDIAVGTQEGQYYGAVWILFLNQDGTVKGSQKITATDVGYPGGFGHSLSSIGDLDGDGLMEIAAGAPDDDDGGTDKGAVWILFLNSNGTVKNFQNISDTEGNFSGPLATQDQFGYSVASLGDFDYDGVTDLAVGAYKDDAFGVVRGAVWILSLNSDGTVKAAQKNPNTEDGLIGTLDYSTDFGTSLASLGDLDGDGVNDIAVGAPEFFTPGSVYILFLNPDGTVKREQKISDGEGGFTGDLDEFDNFGQSVASLGDLDGDRVTDIAVGAIYDNDAGNSYGAPSGAIWILFLNSNGTVKDHQKISDAEGNFSDILTYEEVFGRSVTALGDMDGNGVTDIAVGTYPEDYVYGITSEGGLYVLFLNSDGTVKDHQKINNTVGNFSGDLDDEDHFGHSITALGDIDGDGIPDLAVGAPDDDDAGLDQGAVWILFLNTDGTVKGHQKIIAADSGDLFGSSLASVGDLDGDGIAEMAVGLEGEGIPYNAGEAWILFLNSDGTVKAEQRLNDIEGNFTGDLSCSGYACALTTHFGSAVAPIGDVNGDGVIDLAVGADGNVNGGAVWILFLDQKTLVPLQKGWNLISVPVVAEETAVPDVLSSVYGKYSAVYGYINGSWYSYNATGPAASNTLTDISPEYGYWVQMQESGLLVMDGMPPEEIHYNLIPGWNLLGYPFLEEQPITEAFASIMDDIERILTYDPFDAGNEWKSYDPDKPPFLNTLTTAKPGQGYWVKTPGTSFFEGWESGSISPDWITGGTNNYRIQVTSTNQPSVGQYHLTMDDSISGGAVSLNELTTAIDFTGTSDIFLTFSQKGFGEEAHGCPDSWTTRANGDCVAFTCDGRTWYRAMDLFGSTNPPSYTQKSYDLAADPRFCSSVTSSFAIRFQQYDDYPIPQDGMAFDNIRISYYKPGEGTPLTRGAENNEDRDITNPSLLIPAPFVEKGAQEGE